MKLYTIFDKVANEFGPLFSAKNDAVAKRMVKSMVSNDKHLLHNLDDFDLYIDCDFNTETGVILPTNEQRGSKDRTLPFLLSSLNDIYIEKEVSDDDI